MINASELLAAMEAGETDLTRSTNSLMRQAASKAGANVDPQPAPAAPEGSEEPEATGAPTGGAGDPGMDDGGGGEMDQGAPDENAGLDGMGGDEMGEGGMPEDPMSDPEDPASKNEAKRLLDLQMNIRDLYDRVNVAIDSLGNASPHSGTVELRKIYNAATAHLNDILSHLEEMLTTPFNALTYPKKLKDFVSLRHVYIIVVEMLDDYNEAAKLTDS